LLLYHPWELDRAIAEWVDRYNHERYRESLDNVTPEDVYEGRRNDILDQRAQVKARTMTHRKIHNLRLAVARLEKQQAEKYLLENGPIGAISFADVQSVAGARPQKSE
jgi:hypothetical protein